LSERDKSSVSEMIGETLRRVGVLVLVFVPLEACKGSQLEPWQLILWILVTLVGATALITLGIAIERRRPS
jgi:hypothetical protein